MEQDWECGSCHVRNHASQEVCLTCFLPRFEATIMLQAGGSGMFTMARVPASAKKRQTRPGDWTCDNCCNFNYAFRDICNRCQSVRPAPVVEATPVDESQSAIFGEFMPCWGQEATPVASVATTPGLPTPTQRAVFSPSQRTVFSPADQEAARILSISAALWTGESPAAASSAGGAGVIETTPMSIASPPLSPPSNNHMMPISSPPQTTGISNIIDLSSPDSSTTSPVTSPSSTSTPPIHSQPASLVNIDDILIRDRNRGVMDAAGRGRGRRPGDWTCGLCGNNNYSFRTNCNRCETAKPAVKPPSLRHRPGDWQCHSCGNDNYSFRVVCNRCKLPKLPSMMDAAMMSVGAVSMPGV